MTLRHKLADWISGGELTRLRNRVDRLLQEVSDGIDEAETARAQTESVMDAMLRLNKLDNAKAEALRQIIALKGRALDMNTAVRMARIAREALE